MANRFKQLNKSVNHDNSKRENIFINKNNSRPNERIITGKSLKELGEKPKQDNNFRSNFENRNNRSKNRYNDRKTFSKPIIPKKEEFKVKENEFPELIENVKQEKKEDVCDYKEKVKKVEEEKQIKLKKTLPKGWIKLPINNTNNTNNTNEEISPYYNPTLAVKIIEDRLAYREELNDILGDISPYWNMVYPEELDDYDEDDDIGDNYEEEEEYVEDW